MNKTHIYIIAEAGINHNGSLETAKKMIDAAKDAGADAIKFQTFKVDKLVIKDAKKANYQIEAEGPKHTKETQYEMLRRFELTEAKHYRLQEYCQKKKIDFLSSPFDLESIELLKKMGLKTFKIPSGEITNYPYLQAIGGTKKRILLSTGMSNLAEIKEAVRILKENGSEDIIVMHCNTEYPTPMEDANLRAITTLGRELRLEIGYSDHTPGITAALAAAALGAVVIEKHFTLNRNMEGPDQKASLEPDELKQMVAQIRLVERALGSGIKEPSDSEQKNMAAARKSIRAQNAIRAGERFTNENLAVKRPGNGISPMRFRDLLGQTAGRDYMADELIRQEELERE